MSESFKVDCYIIDVKLKGTWYSLPFICKRHPSEITIEEIVKGIELFLKVGALQIDYIEEFRVWKKTFEVKRHAEYQGS
ncbi:MAG TPA: hypothetical protein ENI59_02290 [Euryarchaeota archaeon]|nr:hypothetical protein [Euryarchaeota archaeon]